eukprot:scaffold396835_cov18-Prasinocladus_malaysianus.AAC.1
MSIRAVLWARKTPVQVVVGCIYRYGYGRYVMLKASSTNRYKWELKQLYGYSYSYAWRPSARYALRFEHDSPATSS